MVSFVDDLLADQPAARARRDRVVPAVITAVGVVITWAKIAWPYIVRAAGWVAEAVAVLFVAVGWVLGFLCWYCPKGLFLGFCEGGKIPPGTGLGARRKTAATEQAPGAVTPAGARP